MRLADMRELFEDLLSLEAAQRAGSEVLAAVPASILGGEIVFRREEDRLDRTERIELGVFDLFSVNLMASLSIATRCSVSLPHG
jgi:hypothetical protein